MLRQLRHRCLAGLMSVALATAAITVGTIPSAHALKLPNVGNHSTTAISSPWLLVNKCHPLSPKRVSPPKLVRAPITKQGTRVLVQKRTASALKSVAAASKRATGKTMTVVSAYRSFAYQKQLYAKYVRTHGAQSADKFSARPGYSEHQTGLALDIGQRGTSTSTALSTKFAGTKTGKWVAKYSWKYGFIVRYPKGATSITGYQYEPWHLRYVGKSLATYMHKQKIKTLEQALKSKAAPRY